MLTFDDFHNLDYIGATNYLFYFNKLHRALQQPHGATEVQPTAFDSQTVGLEEQGRSHGHQKAHTSLQHIFYNIIYQPMLWSVGH